MNSDFFPCINCRSCPSLTLNCFAAYYSGYELLGRAPPGAQGFGRTQRSGENPSACEDHWLRLGQTPQRRWERVPRRRREGESVRSWRLTVKYFPWCLRDKRVYCCATSVFGVCVAYSGINRVIDHVTPSSASSSSSLFHLFIFKLIF